MARSNGDEDLDRELIELLNELRVALPGVQVLFAFLLAVPFQGGTAFLALGMTAAIFLVTDIVFHWIVTLTVTSAIAVAFGLFWYALPLWRRVQRS